MAAGGRRTGASSSRSEEVSFVQKGGRKITKTAKPNAFESGLGLGQNRELGIGGHYIVALPRSEGRMFRCQKAWKETSRAQEVSPNVK